MSSFLAVANYLPNLPSMTLEAWLCRLCLMLPLLALIPS